TTQVATAANTAASAAITGLAAGSSHSYTVKAEFSSGGTNFLSTAAGPASAATVSTCTAASVTTQPTGQSITYGANATFVAAGGGSPSPSVQWQISTNGGATYSSITGA